MINQFIYVCRVRNRHTGNTYVKVGYTSDILRRMLELEKRNPHFEYYHYQLYEHHTKKIGYFFDEQTIHRLNIKNRALINRDAMPEGRTECYESFYITDLVNQLNNLGYQCVYDEVEASKPKPASMFEWD